MLYYYVTQTEYDMLKNMVKNNAIKGVGLLSRIINIDFGQLWKNECIVITSIYDDDSKCVFYFPHRLMYIEEK